MLIASNNSLELLLCGGNVESTSLSMASNTTYELTSSQPYTIPQGDFCVIENISDVTISGSNRTTPTVIKCLESNFSTRGGFAFRNVHNLTLTNIAFEDCGAILTEEVLGEGNSSLLYFDPGEAAVLVCNSCCDFNLLNVHITSYIGRAIVGIDVFGRPRLESVVVSDNTALHQNCETKFGTCKGSGIVWLYTNTTDRECTCAEKTEFTIINSVFSKNTGYAGRVQDAVSCADTLADSFFASNASFEPTSVPSVGAMSLLHQQYSPVAVKIFNSNFTSNRGVCFGAILAIYLSEAAYNSLHFSGSTFSNNSQVLPSGAFRGRYFGSTVTLYMKYLGNYSQNDECLVITDSQFVISSEDEQTFSTSQISLVQFPDNIGFCTATIHNVTGGNTRLLYTLTLSTGDSLDIRLSKINLTGSSIDDSPSLGVGDGLLTFSYADRVLISDSVFFRLTGPIVFAEASYVMFTGNVTFGSAIGSTWTSGAAMFLRGESIIWLAEPLNLTFYNNTAFQGGAIFSVSQYAEYCAIQFITEREYDENIIGDIDISVTFISNSARIAGNSMYIRPLNMCSIRFSPTIRNVKPSVVYDKVFKFKNSVRNGLLEISSTPIQICLCGDDLNNTSRSALRCNGDYNIPQMDTFPGKTFSFSIVPIDESFNRVYSLVYSNPRHEPSANMTELNWQLGYGEDIVQAYGFNCTTFTFTILTGDVGDSATGSIAMYPSESIEGLFIPIKVFNCPPGFELVEGADSCSCPAFLEDRGIQCNVSSGLVSRPGTSWIGIAEYIENYTVLTAEDIDLGFSDHCPTRYCNQTESMVNISEDSLCLLGRTGVLCGKCKSNLSVTIGSPECQTCSNWWLFTLPFYALLGVVIVVFLLILQLTVAQGTINGLIFYANVLSISTYYLFGFKGTQWAIIFISFLNLELGFPVCLYDGLDDIIKAILSIIFPMYIWLISITLVYASRFSHQLAQLTSQSAIPVLATLIYITYYELLRFSVDGLAFSTIHRQKESDNIVWYYDGNIRYLRDYRHVCLFCLVLIAVCVFILPYGILLTGIRFFIRFRIINKFRPLIDAYCAPYKDKYRFWFGLRIWVLVAIYILFAGLRNTPQILFLCQSIVLILFIIAQVAVMPFKNVIINWLDLFFMTNALLLSVVALHGVPIGIQIASSLSVAAALVAFFCIVGYHSWILWKRVKVLYEEWKERKYALKADKTEPVHVSEPITQTSLIISNSTECRLHYQDFVNVQPSKFRDSILEDSAIDSY